MLVVDDDGAAKSATIHSEPKSFIDIGKSNVREMAFFNDSYDTNITINSAFLYLNVCMRMCCIDFFTSFSSSQFLN